MRRSAVLLGSAIDDAVGKALQCLRVNFRTPSAGEAGWYHYLDSEEPGVTASAVALYCFELAGMRFERTDDVVRYLIDQQVHAVDDQDGGWSIRTTHGFPIIESTAWAIRALSYTKAGLTYASDSTKDGVRYVERHQNTDFGWGSHRGQPSRIFHTALAMMALAETGGDQGVIDNGKKWMISAQSPSQPAWGSVPNSDPTVFHTSVALRTLLGMPAALPLSSVREVSNWLLEQLQPDVYTERTTAVEEFDVPYRRGTDWFTFQNSLPHFATPNALVAVLRAGVDPLQSKVLDTIESILDTQQASGAWELPRSPNRESIWAIWPFVAALVTAKEKLVPVPDSKLTLLFPGCAIVQTSTSASNMTSGRLIRSILFDWVRRRKIALTLWFLALLTVVGPLSLVILGKFSWADFLVSLVIPVLLLTFQIIWDKRKSTTGGAAP